MKRSPGVTVIAILALLGSALTLLLGVGMLIVTLVMPATQLEPYPSPSVPLKMIFVFLSLMYLVPAGIGIASGIGLLRLRNWARISTIVFAVVLISISIFPALLMAFMPFPIEPGKSLDQSTIIAFRTVMSAFWVSLIAVGVWWLVFFTRRGVRQQFQPARVQEDDQRFQPGAHPVQAQVLPVTAASPRPVSITVIACLMIGGSGLMLPGLVFQSLFHMPAILFTKLITGWPAVVLYGTLALAQLCIGWGLLKLKPIARTLALAYFTFGLLNMAVFYLAPGHQARIAVLLESATSIMQWPPGIENHPYPQFQHLGIIAGSVFAAIGIALQMYFVFTRKAAFETARNGL